jgi:hypothetical protein
MGLAGMRMVAAATAVAALILSVHPSLAQSGDPKAGTQRQPGGEADAQKKADDFAEAAKVLGGPASQPECVWAGRHAIQLLIKNDIDTAFRHMELYDRFGCPSGHVQAAFRCLVLQGAPDMKSQDSLGARAQACWINPTPELNAPPPSAAASSPTTNR